MSLRTKNQAGCGNMVLNTCGPSAQEWRQEDQEFQASLGYILCLRLAPHVVERTDSFNLSFRHNIYNTIKYNIFFSVFIFLGGTNKRSKGVVEDVQVDQCLPDMHCMYHIPQRRLLILELGR